MNSQELRGLLHASELTSIHLHSTCNKIVMAVMVIGHSWLKNLMAAPMHCIVSLHMMYASRFSSLVYNSETVRCLEEWKSDTAIAINNNNNNLSFSTSTHQMHTNLVRRSWWSLMKLLPSLFHWLKILWDHILCFCHRLWMGKAERSSWKYIYSTGFQCDNYAQAQA